MAVRIDVDLDLCQGHAMCELEAPEHFRVPKRGKVEIVNPSPAQEDWLAVERAEWVCPARALRLRHST